MQPAGIKGHVNPVYGSYFADPYVWKHGDVYYAIGTGALEAAGQTLGKIFPVLVSQDFFTWQFASNAMVRPDPGLGDNFWAPAVAYSGGLFYLYYSVGFGDKNHQLRVATSDAPQGPYQDCGISLRDPGECAFAIDPHPFQDDDGKWYLFFSQDFLDTENGYRAGTGLVVAPLRDMTQLDCDPRLVLRPHADWQRFQSPRSMYGRTWDWHTLEGPSVCKHDGLYYCFYSGGRWETESYGVDYCVAERVLGPYRQDRGLSAPRVLRTVPQQVLGPGHNSVITGPEGTDYIVYHAWDKEMKARRMFLDKLAWTPEGPRCQGPTWGAGFETGIQKPTLLT